MRSEIEELKSQVSHALANKQKELTIQLEPLIDLINELQYRADEVAELERGLWDLEQENVELARQLADDDMDDGVFN